MAVIIASYFLGCAAETVAGKGSTSNNFFNGIAGFGVIGLIIWGVASIDYGKVWYSWEYGVEYGQVRIDARPSDCDFMHAPMGDKGCYYTQSAEALNLLGEWIGGAGAQDLRAHTVHVFWRRVTD